MKNYMTFFYEGLQILQGKMVLLVIVAVVLDTIFGCFRAIKQKKFNSSVGIDGGIRKISMLISLVGLAVIDVLAKINIIAFIPEELREYLGCEVIGLTEFFALLFIAYEAVSILKNMYYCELPVKWLWFKVSKFLSKYTEELPDVPDDLEEEYENAGQLEEKIE